MEKEGSMMELESIPIKTENKQAEWYQHLDFGDVKAFIRSNIAAASRSFIAIGYYLKYARDKQLYEEDGHASIWDFAREEYGISKSTASRYMTINDRFSKGGNSPIVAEEFKAYGKSQLQEMLYLNDEQLDQVTPDTQVKQIREIRQPVREIPYIAIPGQMEVSDFLDMDLEPEIPGKELSEVSAALEMPTQTMACVMQASDFLGADAKSVATSQQEELQELLPQEQNMEENPITTGVAEVQQEELPEPNENWNLGDLPQVKEKYLKQLAEKLVEKMGSRIVMAEMSSIPSDETIKKYIQVLARQEGGVIALEDGVEAFTYTEIIEFSRGDEDFGVCSYIRLANQVRKALEEWAEQEPTVTEMQEQAEGDSSIPCLASAGYRTRIYCLEDVEKEILGYKSFLEYCKGYNSKNSAESAIKITTLRLDAMLALKAEMEVYGEEK